MNKFFYAKLAGANIKKNAKTYIPYIITCITTIMMFNIMVLLTLNDNLKEIGGGAQIQMILQFGWYVVGLFSLVFLFYTNSFLIKRRKKEFGLFNILGMEKKHIAKVIFLETIYIALLSLAIGLLLSVLLSKLMFLLLLKILSFTVPLEFTISKAAIIITTILFASIFLLTLLSNLRQIHLSNPIELLKGESTGEKEPKTKWFITLVGIITLASGYYISLTTENPLSALFEFLIAVILVIIGTYCLFTAGSIAILKLLRKNKKFYYKTKNFVSISGMIYRMKQNAVGLANIAILSTIVLVIASTTISLYIGVEDVVRTRYPRNITINTTDYSKANVNNLKKITNNVLDKHNENPKDTLEYTYIGFPSLEEDNKFLVEEHPGNEFMNMSDLRELNIITLEDYNRLSNSSKTLKENEVLMFSNRTPYEHNDINIFDKNFKVIEKLDSMPIIGLAAMDIISSHYIVVKDMNMLEYMNQKQAEVYGKQKSEISYFYGFDLDTSDDNSTAFYNELQSENSTKALNAIIESSVVEKSSFYSIYGGLLFIGIFLVILFMMATILIIYYKQISEGYDDKNRFDIMQKVGMSKSEVKKIIRSQVLTVFFLPLVTAIVHICFAFPVITKLLQLFNLTNTNLFIACTAGTIAVFGVCYAIIYSITAREYYKIVQQ